MGKSKYKYKVYNGRAIKEVFENSRVVVLTVMFSIGIIIGAKGINSGSTEHYEKIKNLLSSFALNRAGQGISENFMDSLTGVGVYSAAALFLAFSLIGYPIIMLLPLIRGMGIGAVFGYLYSAYGFTGIGYSLLMIYPGALFSIISLLLICNESCEYSKNAYSKSVLNKGNFEKDETKYFMIRQILFFAVGAFGSLVDAASIKLFAGVFNL